MVEFVGVCVENMPLERTIRRSSEDELLSHYSYIMVFHIEWKNVGCSALEFKRVRWLEDVSSQ